MGSGYMAVELHKGIQVFTVSVSMFKDHLCIGRDHPFRFASKTQQTFISKPQYKLPSSSCYSWNNCLIFFFLSVYNVRFYLMCRIKQQNIITFNADLSCQNKEQLLVVVINLTMDCRYCDINQSYATIIIAKYHFWMQLWCFNDTSLQILFTCWKNSCILTYITVSSLVTPSAHAGILIAIDTTLWTKPAW